MLQNLFQTSIRDKPFYTFVFSFEICKTKYKGVKCFVRSDSEGSLNSEGVLNGLKKGKYSDRIVTGSGTMDHIVHDSKAYKRAILDVELLAKCDELVITGGSTYGFVSAMKSLKLPLKLPLKLCFMSMVVVTWTKCVRTGVLKMKLF